MASVNDPTWSYGESKLFDSSGATTDPDDAWIYGENRLLHEYVVSAEDIIASTINYPGLGLMSFSTGRIQ